MNDFTLADQDWIGLIDFQKFCRSGLDLDWKFSQSAHLCWTGEVDKKWGLDSAEADSACFLPMQSLRTFFVGGSGGDIFFKQHVLQTRECLHFRTVPQEHWLFNKDSSRRARNYNKENQTPPFHVTHSVNTKKYCIHSWFY